MKTAFTLILSIALTYHSYAQDVKIDYFKSDKNEIYTQKEYSDLKKEILSEFKKANQLVKIKENFGAIEKKGDTMYKHFSFTILPLLADENKKQMSQPKFGEHLIGQKLPETILSNFDGSEIETTALNGKPTMINFWFTSCKPCIDEFPVLNKLKEKYSNEVNFVSITFDDKLKVQKLTEKFAFDFDKYIDAKDYIKILGIEAYPTSLFLDKNGVVKYAEGGIPYIIDNGNKRVGDGKEFAQLIETLLN